MKDFNSLPWHDANILSIDIDRRHPGEQDVIRLLIQWPEDISLWSVEFYDCYCFIANMNFGIIASESILTAQCIQDSKEINSIREKWSKSNFILENLKCFQINTNSTNSTLNIYALGFRIREISSNNDR